MLWFWKMEGARWNLDSGSFDAAKKAWRRLVAEEDERHAESAKRRAREDAAEQREVQERLAGTRMEEQRVRDVAQAEVELRVQGSGGAGASVARGVCRAAPLRAGAAVLRGRVAA